MITASGAMGDGPHDPPPWRIIMTGPSGAPNRLFRGATELVAIDSALAPFALGWSTFYAWPSFKGRRVWADSFRSFLAESIASLRAVVLVKGHS